MTGAGMSNEPRPASDAPPQGTDGPVTSTVTRRVKPGHESFYDQFLQGVIAAASRFPGHLGVEVFRPESATADDDRVVYRFDTGEPPYKMALLTWLTIFPLITLVVVALEPLLEELALVPRLALTTAATVPIMTWLVMPRVTRLLRRWLYPDHPAVISGALRP